jgi:hypothetical protein
MFCANYLIHISSVRYNFYMNDANHLNLIYFIAKYKRNN